MALKHRGYCSGIAPVIECATQVRVASSGVQAEPIVPEEAPIANGKLGWGVCLPCKH